MKLKYSPLFLGAMFTMFVTDGVFADNSNKTPLNQTKSAEKEKSDIEIWWQAARDGDIGRVKSMFSEKKFDINQKTKMGNTALLLALSSSKIKDASVAEKMYKFFIENGADVNVKNLVKTTALQYAVKKGYFNIVQSLVKKKVDLNVQSSLGRTALMDSVSLKDSSILKLLVNSGADISLKTSSGETAFLMAVQHGAMNNIKILVDNGVNVNETNSKNHNALTKVITTKFIKTDTEKTKREIVEILIDNNVDVNIVDSEGQTPLSLAKAQRRLVADAEKKKIWSEIVTALEDAGATD